MSTPPISFIHPPKMCSATDPELEFQALEAAYLTPIDYYTPNSPVITRAATGDGWASWLFSGWGSLSLSCVGAGKETGGESAGSLSEGESCATTDDCAEGLECVETFDYIYFGEGGEAFEATETLCDMAGYTYDHETRNCVDTEGNIVTDDELCTEVGGAIEQHEDLRFSCTIPRDKECQSPS